MRTIACTVAAALLLTGCGTRNHTAAPARSTAAPAPTYDGSTLDACKEADQSTDPADKGYEHAKAARGFAELSDVPALREVARKFTDDTDLFTPRDDAQALAAAITISTWCLQHHVK